MSNWFIVFCYIIAAYGASLVVVFGSGPFRILEHLRNIATRISEHFGLMFQCMMCFPTNFGILSSLLSSFLLPVKITPFTIIFASAPGLWWLAMLLDGGFTGGIVWAIHHFVELLEKKSDETNVQYEDVPEQDVILTEDITRKH